MLYITRGKLFYDVSLWGSGIALIKIVTTFKAGKNYLPTSAGTDLDNAYYVAICVAGRMHMIILILANTAKYFFNSNRNKD